MADKTRIKVAVVEGDYADHCGLGLPLALSLQLQLQDLKLSGALWSAKASASGFSVSLYWPTTTASGHKARVKKPRRKRKRGKAKQQAIPNASNVSSNVTTPSAPALATSESLVTPINAHPSPERALPPPKSTSEASLTRDSSCVDLKTCSDVQYEVRDGVHGVSYHFSSDEGTGWTPVVGRRQKRKAVPDFVRRRFPPGHPIHRSNSDNDSGSEDLDLDTVIPTRASVDVQFKVIDNTPGLAVKTQNTQSWTPIATRTRARLKK